MQKAVRFSTVAILIISILLINSCKKDEDSVIKDGDGNVYTTVTIGTQVWLKENLKTTNYNDGTSIPLVTEKAVWNNLSTPAYCWYDNNEASYKSIYGALYNWYSVNTAKLCPTGWHVPTNTEWTALVTFLGGENVAGDKLRESGTAHWSSPNTGATNETGFTALPGGCRFDGNIMFFNIRNSGFWWSSTEFNTTSARSMSMFSVIHGIDPWVDLKTWGFSVRCIKDN
jgi:uncharacterized protein (TIGR02145 family)